MSHPLHLVAAARGIEPLKPSRCTYCVQSPFGDWGTISACAESVLRSTRLDRTALSDSVDAIRSRARRLWWRASAGRVVTA
jgi:hypothetical protein